MAAEKINFKVGTVITIMVLITSVVAAHFQGQAASKEYTDAKVTKAQENTDKKVDQIQNDVNKMKIDVEVVKQILVQKFGQPN